MLIRVALEPLSKLLELYPKANEKAAQQLGKDFQYISNQEFKRVKQQICVFKELGPLLKKHLKLEKQTYHAILAAVLEGNAGQASAKVKGDSRASKRNMSARPGFKPTTWIWRSAIKAFSSGENDIEDVVDDLIGHATEAAEKISDSQFLGQLEQDVRQYAPHVPLFKDLADKGKERAFMHLEVGIGRALKRLTPTVHRTQEQESAEHIKREHARRAEEELDQQRVKLIRHVNNIPAQATSSYVCRP